jgi:DNA-directed RNA polymerase subunit alpha
MISLPQKPKVTTLDDHSARFEIGGCYPGYGATLGNALRRVLLSSLEGAAVQTVKIKGVSHEFGPIDGVMEDVVQILLNVKQLRFLVHTDEPVTVTLKKKGDGAVTASDIQTSSSVEVVDPTQPIATISDKKTELSMEFVVSQGIGYVPVEGREREEREIGMIAVDSIYTPIRRVNYEVENMRVGKRTDYDKVSLDVVTDGSITPEVAFQKAVSILISQFSALEDESVTDDAKEVLDEASPEPAKKKVTKKAPMKKTTKKTTKKVKADE